MQTSCATEKGIASAMFADQSCLRMILKVELTTPRLIAESTGIFGSDPEQYTRLQAS